MCQALTTEQACTLDWYKHYSLYWYLFCTLKNKHQNASMSTKKGILINCVGGICISYISINDNILLLLLGDDLTLNISSLTCNI